jgi:hypothetical protein
VHCFPEDGDCMIDKLHELSELDDLWVDDIHDLTIDFTSLCC